MSPARDPYDELRDGLVRAASATEPRRARMVRWLSRHTAIAVIAGTALTATATAAVVTGLRGTPSAPLDGALVPARPGADGSTLSPGRYRISMAPLIQAGYVGWCASQSTFREDPAQRSGSGTCFGLPIRPFPEANGSVTDGAGGAVAFSIVDTRVAGVRLPGGHVILARTDRRLPAGFRSIVVQSGDPAHGYEFGHRDLASWRFVDARGAVISRPGLTEGAGTDELVAPQPVRQLRGAAFPTDAPCRLAAEGGWPGDRRGVRAEVLRRAPTPLRVAIGRPYLTCATVTAGPRIDAPRVSVLLDAKRPGAMPAALPGLAGPDDGSVVEVAGGGIASMGAELGKPPVSTAQRRGRAWLVVQGGTEPERRALIARVAVELNL